MGEDNNGRVRALGIVLAAAGLAGLGMIAARRMKRSQENGADYEEHDEGEDSDHQPFSKTVFRIVTIKAHPANVEADWNEFVGDQGSDESRDATMEFRAAPGGRGTEIRGELTYTPRGGKLGDVAQRIAHKSPGQRLGQDLKRFKMMVEAGEPVKSDASIHKHMHPAQPDERLGNANLVQEAAR